MSGNYQIISKVPHDSKFACYVKFNEEIDAEFYKKYENGGEYWESDSLDASEIALALQQAADADKAYWDSVDANKAQTDKISIVDGKIVL